MSMPIQSTELQSTLPTTVAAEANLGPSSAQGAHIEDNNLPNIDNGNSQPAMPNRDHGELLPVANDNHNPAGIH